MNTTPKESPHASPERESRVAAALRENLRKRKAQSQLRSVSEHGAGSAQSGRAQPNEDK